MTPGESQRDPLQWGRGLLAAEMRHARQAAAWIKELQWGRGLLAAEMEREDANTIRAAIASMGPRLVSRGNAAQHKNWIATHTFASMGPRLVSRGNPSTVCRLRLTGSSFNGAAAC